MRRSFAGAAGAFALGALAGVNLLPAELLREDKDYIVRMNARGIPPNARKSKPQQWFAKGPQPASVFNTLGMPRPSDLVLEERRPYSSGAWPYSSRRSAPTYRKIGRRA